MRVQLVRTDRRNELRPTGGSISPPTHPGRPSRPPTTPHLGFPDYHLIWGSHVRMTKWMMEITSAILPAPPCQFPLVLLWRSHSPHHRRPSGTWHRDTMTSSMKTM